MTPLASPRQRRAFAWGAATLVLLGGLGLGTVSFLAADRLVHPPRDLDPATPADAGLAFSDVRFPSADGIPLAGWWVPATHAVGTVVFLHGYGASKAQSMSILPFLHQAGYAVLALDFRGHGASGGDHTTVGIDEVRDVQGAMAWLAGRDDVDQDRIALFGWSMGAATALNAAPALPQVRAIVADSSFAILSSVAMRTLASAAHMPETPVGRLAMVFASWMTGTHPTQDEPVRAVANEHRPVLFIQGLADDLLGADDAVELQRAAGSDGQLWLVPGALHVDSHRSHAAEYEARVLRFLHDAFAQPSSRPATDPPS